MITKEDALSKIAQQTRLAEIYKFECARTETLIDLALSRSDPSTHWQDYECLKRFASRMVGHHANCKELQTSAHYEALMLFLDWLLPEEIAEEQKQAS